MTLALTPAIADPLSGTDEYPDVAFLARNDVPFDAQTAASMAAQLGAPMFITNPGALADAARDGIAELNPDVIIVAGGVFAISDAVANEAAAACDPDCTVDRRAGAGRDETAAVLAEIAADYGFDRPVLQGSNQVVGDVHVGGTVNADTITVQDTGLVSGLNADRLDGMHASDFLGATEKAADSELLDGKDSTEFLGATEQAADSDLLDGKDADDVSFPTTLSPGVSLTGFFGFDHDTDGTGDVGAQIDFGLDVGAVPTKNFVPSGGSDPDCTGSVAQPTAPAGHLCLYEAGSFNVTFTSFFNSVDDSGRRGAVAFFNLTASGDAYFHGTWAVTAPASSTTSSSSSAGASAATK